MECPVLPSPSHWLANGKRQFQRRLEFSSFSCLSLRNGGGGEIILFYLDGEGGLEKSCGPAPGNEEHWWFHVGLLDLRGGDNLDFRLGSSTNGLGTTQVCYTCDRSLPLPFLSLVCLGLRCTGYMRHPELTFSSSRQLLETLVRSATKGER